jgi:hypothetical protein
MPTPFLSVRSIGEIPYSVEFMGRITTRMFVRLTERRFARPFWGLPAPLNANVVLT